MKHPIKPDPRTCDHGVRFEREPDGKDPGADAIRKKWPRLMGVCPKGCGYSGIAYASFEHYIAGDW